MCSELSNWKESLSSLMFDTVTLWYLNHCLAYSRINWKRPCGSSILLDKNIGSFSRLIYWFSHSFLCVIKSRYYSIFAQDTLYSYRDTTVHHIRITCDSHTSHIRLTCESHTNHIRVTYDSHANHMRITYESHTSHIRLTCESHANHIRVTYESHTSHIRVTYENILMRV